MKTLRAFATRDEGGQSLVEFALMLPLILLIITGLFDVARATWQENTLAYAAREGTRYAIVHGSAYPDPNLIQWPGPAGGPAHYNETIQVVRNAAVGVGGTITVTATWPGPDGVLGNSDDCYERNCPVAVVATAQFIPLPSQYMLGGAFQVTLKGGSQLVIQR